MNAVAYDLTHRLRPVPLLVVREDTQPSYAANDEVDWRHVDKQVCRLGVERAAHEREVCCWLAAAARLGVPARLGMASLDEYALRRLGLNGRQTEERLRVGRALSKLPVLDAALTAGKLCWSAVRELTRVAQPSTERAWREWAEGKSAREVEKRVAGMRAGDLPSNRPDPTREKHRLSFEVRAETMAMFRELQAAIREELGGEVVRSAVDDDLVLYEVVRRAMAGGGKEASDTDEGGRAPYQVAVTRCDRCREVAVDAAGEHFVVDDVVAEMVACDAQHISQVGEMAEPRGAGPHVGVGARMGDERTARRATQTVPPATRRRVLRRAGSCCGVPGCRNHRHLHVHHVKPRSEGGGHDPLLLVALCHRHHTAVHDGALVISGDANSGFSFHHADGTRYGLPTDAVAIDVATRAFDALRQLGFKMTEARKLIETVQRAGPPPTLEAFVHAALRAT